MLTNMSANASRYGSPEKRVAHGTHGREGKGKEKLNR
jgi:hypothetical protein